MRRLAFALLVAVLLPAAAARAEVLEELEVPTRDGATVHVEIARPDGDAKVPVILTYSPYNSLNGSPVTNLASGSEWVEKGYARAYADVVGTRNSSGCWDYGGPIEQRSGVDLVGALSQQPWSNGRVAMTGTSYDGTTANMVAAAGDVPGLAAIVPIAAINHWYGYAYQDGVRYLANSENPADEGFDTPLGFDFGFGRTPPDRPLAAQAMLDRMKPCDAAEHTERAYATDPRYDAFWLERDYRKDAARFRVPAFVVHGWQDYNVKQSEGVDLFEAIPVDDPATPAAEGVPFKLAHFHQAAHDDGGGDEYDERLEKFFARTLKGEANGIELEPAVRTQTRSGTTPGEFERTTAWPPPGTGTVTLRLGDLKGTGESFTDTGATTEESALASGLAARPDAVAYVTEPLAEPMRLAGSAVLRARVTVDDSAGHLNATLADVAPDGSATAIARGHHNIRFRDGLAEPKPIPAGEPVEARVRMSPQDQTVEAGHSLGLIVTGSNVAWAVPVTGRRTFALDLAGSRLELPVVGAAQSPPPALTRKPRLTVRLRRAGPGRVRVTGVASPRALLRVTLRGPRRVIVSRRILVPPRGRYKLHLRVRARRVRAVVRGAGLVARSGVIRVRVPTRCGGRRRPSRPRGGSGGSGRPKARCRR